MGANDQWFGARLDQRVEVHVRRELVRTDGSTSSPVALTARSAVNSRLLLWQVFLQAVGERALIPTRDLLPLVGLRTPAGRRTDGADSIAYRHVERAAKRLGSLGLSTKGRPGLQRPQELFGCGIRISGAGSAATAMQPGHAWRARRDFTIPATFWTRGWVAQLESLEMIVVLALLSAHADERSVVMRAGRVRQEIGIAGESWRSASQSLDSKGLVVQELVPGTRQSYRYRLDRGRLLEPPG